MGEGDIKKLIMGFVIVGSLFTGLAYFMSSAADIYGFDDNSNTLAAIDRYNDFSEQMGLAENTTISTGVDVSTGLDNPYTGAWTVVLNLINIPSVMGGMVEDLASLTGLSVNGAWFLSLVVLLLIIIVIFGTIKAFTGVTP